MTRRPLLSIRDRSPFVVDEREEQAHRRAWGMMAVRPAGRWHYGFIDWKDLFKARAIGRGRPYRAGDCGRRSTTAIFYRVQG